MCDAGVLAVCWWSFLLGLDFVGMGKADVLLGQLHRPASMREGHFSFPTLLRNHLILLQMNHFPESQIFLWEYGDHLVFQFPTYP